MSCSTNTTFSSSSDWREICRETSLDQIISSDTAGRWGEAREGVVRISPSGRGIIPGIYIYDRIFLRCLTLIYLRFTSQLWNHNLNVYFTLGKGILF